MIGRKLWGVINMEDNNICKRKELELAPDNEVIRNSIQQCFDFVEIHERIMCAISGGWDSDIMLDLLIRCGAKDKTDFFFYDTGLEYDATKEHIAYLKEKYNIEITTIQPKKHVPTCVKEYGVPFWSKYASDMIQRLQRHNFQWEDESFEKLYKKYPKCKSSLKWWCDEWEATRFNIKYVKGLKEFLIKYPPAINISAMCCEKSKKSPAKTLENSKKYDLICTGIRKSEGGKRSTVYNTCFDSALGFADRYRPLFFWKNSDKEEYTEYYKIIRSDCYEVWGLKRTGCVGCPFAKDFISEYETVKKFEPKKAKAIKTVFGDSYEYTKKFLKFRENL